jgi:outer membrane protein TolC
LATSLNQSLDFSKPYFSFGVRFTAPLAFGTASDVQRGYEVAKIAAEASAEKAFFDSEQDWKDLSRAFAVAKERVTLAVQLEQLQRAKLEHERNRLQRGRSTTYQIILFEGDYSQAVLSLVRASSDLLRIYSQLKVFH